MCVESRLVPTWKEETQMDILFNYLEFGKEAAMYVKNMGYNYIQFMPLMEYRDRAMAGAAIPVGNVRSDIEIWNTYGVHGYGRPFPQQGNRRYHGYWYLLRDVDCIAYWIDTYHLDGVRLEDEELIRALRTTLGTAGDAVMTDLRWNNEAVSRVTDFMMIPPVNRRKLYGLYMWYTI